MLSDIYTSLIIIPPYVRELFVTDAPTNITLTRTPKGEVKAGATLTIMCNRDAARPSPHLLLKRDGQVMKHSYNDSLIVYEDVDTSKGYNLMNYTCEATGEGINHALKSHRLMVPLTCKDYFYHHMVGNTAIGF